MLRRGMAPSAVPRVLSGTGWGWLSVVLALITGLAWSVAQSADARRGAELFNQQCSYCHSLSARTGPKLVAPPRRLETGAERQREPEIDWPVVVGQYQRGPHLESLFRRAPGAVKGFPYRITLKTESATWTESDLDFWIYNHARLGEADRSDLVAYLKQATDDRQ